MTRLQHAQEEQCIIEQEIESLFAQLSQASSGNMDQVITEELPVTPAHYSASQPTNSLASSSLHPGNAHCLDQQEHTLMTDNKDYAQHSIAIRRSLPGLEPCKRRCMPWKDNSFEAKTQLLMTNTPRYTVPTLISTLCFKHCRQPSSRRDVALPKLCAPGNLTLTLFCN